MFFAPKCPVAPKTKDSIEESFLWLLQNFGEDSFERSEIILPSDKKFPERLFANEKSIQAFLKVICGFMDVDYNSVSLTVFADRGQKKVHPLSSPDSIGSKACGLYYFYRRKHQIAIDQSLLGVLPSLVATIAHELAHAKLQSHLADEEEMESEELLTDLATVFFGMGIFTANSIFGVNQFRNVQYQGWRAAREGYIDEESAGYALALFAFMKRDLKPAWAKYLETNPKHYFKQGLKYLVKTGDTKVSQVR